MRGRSLMVGAALLLASDSPRAADCKTPVTQTDLNICSGQDFTAADTALNQVYDRLLRAPTMAGRLDRLRAAERAWVAFHTAQCAFEGSAAEGGSMQPMLQSGCAATLTRQRTKSLGDALACAEGGTGC